MIKLFETDDGTRIEQHHMDNSIIKITENSNTILISIDDLRVIVNEFTEKFDSSLLEDPVPSPVKRTSARDFYFEPVTNI